MSRSISGLLINWEQDSKGASSHVYVRFIRSGLRPAGVFFFQGPRQNPDGPEKAWKSFENILPQMLGIIVLIGILLAILSPETISSLIGAQSGWIGIVVSA